MHEQNTFPPFELADIERALIGASVPQGDLWNAITRNGLLPEYFIPTLITTGHSIAEVNTERARRQLLKGSLPIFDIPGLYDLSTMGIEPAIKVMPVNKHGFVPRSTQLYLVYGDEKIKKNDSLWQRLQIRSTLSPVVSLQAGTDEQNNFWKISFHDVKIRRPV